MGRKKIDITREHIIAMLDQGMTKTQIAFKYGTSINLIGYRLNPEIYERQKAANKARYADRKPRKPSKAKRFVLPENPTIEDYMLDWQKVKVAGKLPPKDTRDNTGKLLGDPLPERSALAKMRQRA